MGSDVIIAYHGKPRCAWARQGPRHRRQRPRDAVRIAEPRGTREVLRDHPQASPRSVADLPKSTPQAEAFAKQLKSQGYRFIGPTSVYAFMQNVGVVNDHLHGCFRAVDYRAATRSP
jgi:hypothetical protein